MEIWAHRGRLLPGLPGNTLTDFQKIYELGIHGIETDVCFTAPDEDGSQEPIIHHPDLKDRNDPSKMSRSYLKFRPQINILRLDYFLAFLNVRPNLFCCLDIKQENEKLVNTAIDKIILNGLENRIYITSFQTRIPWLGLETSGKILLRAKIRNPKIKTHLIATFPFSLPNLTRKYNPDIISLGWLPESKLSIWLFKTFFMKIINLKYQINKVRAMGVKVISGIANDREGFEYLADLGVDGIMTDNSTAAMEFTKSKSP